MHAQKMLFVIFVTLFYYSCIKNDNPTDTNSQNKTPSLDTSVFEIYLADTGLSYVPQPVPNESLTICDTPILDTSDFSTYDTLHHKIALTLSGMEKISVLDKLSYVFVACVNRVPVYNGRFMSLASSYVFRGPVINFSRDPYQDTLSIEIGSPPNDTLPDPRGNPIIFKALRAMNKAR
jgi:hypothetical protein